MKFTLDVTHDEYARYKQFLKRDKPRYKVYRDGFIRCPACDYVVDNCVSCQNFCDRCGQRLVDAGYFNSNKKQILY